MEPVIWGPSDGRPRRPETVVPRNRLLSIFAGVSSIGAVGIISLATISVSTADEWSEYLANGTCVAFFVWFMVLIASTRVDGAGDELVVVNFVRTVTVPAVRVRGAEAENGLTIVLYDDNRIDCDAYGSSVLQELIPRLRPRRHVHRVEEWAARHGGGPGATGGGIGLRATVRPYVWLGLPALWLGSMAYMTVVRAAADPLRALFQVPM